MKINRRVVNEKGHTVGYILTGGRRVTRAQAVSLASKGKLRGVRVINGKTGSYVQSLSTVRSLAELPETRVSTRKTRQTA